MARCICLVLMLVALALLPARSMAQADLAAQQRATQAVQEGRYGEALTLLNRLIGAEPSNGRAYLLRARAYEGRADYGRAARDYEQALKINPNDAEAEEGARRARAQEAEAIQTKLEQLKRLVAASPENIQLRLQYADELYGARRFREAADAYEAYLERTQGTPDIVRRLLISIAGYEGDSDRGERIVQRYLAFYPTDDDLYMRLGYFRLWQHKEAEAVQAFEQALKLNPANQDAQNGLRELRQPTVARTAESVYPIDVLTRELKQEPGNHAKRAELVDRLIEAGRYAEAKQHLEKLPTAQRATDAWQQRHALVTEKLAALEPAQPATEFIVDRLFRELKQNPNQDEKRFRLIGELIAYERYYEAYDQLVVLAKRHDATDRWLDLFADVDNGLERTLGASPLYAIDRLTYRLRHDPDNEAFRFALVDALLEVERVEEAFAALSSAPSPPTDAAAYRARLDAITKARESYRTQRIGGLEQALETQPNDAEALADLALLYSQDNRLEDALTLQERLLAFQPENDEARYRYALWLGQAGYPEDALQEAIVLLRRDPEDEAYQRLYALKALPLRPGDRVAEAFVTRILEAHPRDVDFLLDLASLRLAQGDAEAADKLLRRAHPHANAAQDERIETMGLLVERELVRQRDADQAAILDAARTAASEKQFADAVEHYEAFFERRGKRTPDELRELAGVYSAAGDYVQALSILETLQEYGYTYEVAKEIARNRYYLADYAGAIREVGAMLEQRPNDYDAWLLLGDSYRELGHFERAREVYQKAATFARGSRLVEDRLAMLEQRIRYEIAQQGGSSGLDYAGVLAPVTEVIRAEGSGTSYERFAQGLLTQVALPAPIMVTAGVTSHFLNGTRRLIPDAETVRERVNQIYVGGYVDLTPPITWSNTNYTNRLSAQVGLFDYAGGRTVAFGSLRYSRQVPGAYLASVGVRSTEGAIELWSPAGSEFALRLTQFDVRASSDDLLPDSLLRLNGVVAYNLVSDQFGTTSTASGTNVGHTVQVDASYRVIPSAYLGATFYRMGYRTTTDIYFSPGSYQSYDVWLEYEREHAPKWYFRTRGALGLVARSRGFVSRRFEADIIYRLTSRLSLVLNGSIGQSTRSLGQSSDTTADRYRTLIFTGSLYWTL